MTLPRLRFAAAISMMAGLSLSYIPAAEAAGSGAEIYRMHCARCHGFDGVPDLPGTPSFARGEGLLKSDQALIEAIRRGIGTMPGFDDQIENEDLIDVLFYIRTFER